MSINLAFTEHDWERTERNWSAWWEHELPRPLVMIHGKAPTPGKRLPHVEPFLANYPMDMAADEILDLVQPNFEATRWYGDAWPKWWINFGPGIIAGFIGSAVHAVPRTVWFEPLAQRSIADVRPVYDADNVWWQRVLAVTKAAVGRFGRAVSISHTDLGGNLDIVASLRGTEQLLYDLYDAPQEVERLVKAVTPLWLRYYRELEQIIARLGRGTTPWATIWSAKRCYMLQCDFSYMISPAMFERFVLPDLAACCDYLDHGFYHLDGKGQLPHLDMMLSLERLRGIQWIPGAGAPPPQRWLDVLKHIKDAGKLCQLYVTSFGARRIVRELGGRGFALHIREQMTAPEAADFLKLLAAEDCGR